jgi:hypothetical protein
MEKDKRVGTLDLAKLAAERAARKAQLTSSQHQPFTGSGRRVDGRPLKKKSNEKTDEEPPPPPAPQARPATISAPRPGASTNRSKLIERFRKRKEAGAFAGSGNTM